MTQSSFNTNSLALHTYQKSLIQKLTKTQKARFNDLLIDGLESEHMNYHLQRLIDYGLVKKDSNGYSLTDYGKDYSNLTDEVTHSLEKQPKVSVLLNVVRNNSQSGETQNLVMKRLKHPYYGKIGRLTGKIRFGETIEEASRQELMEETGLDADKVILEKISHKIVKNEHNIYIQDVIFFKVFILNPTGSLILNPGGQENMWITESDLKREDLDFYNDYEFSDRIEPEPLSFSEYISLKEGF